MKRKIQTGFLFIFLLLSLMVFGQGYRITIQIKGSQDTALLVASYYGDKIRLVDTARATAPGKFVLQGKKTLPGGVYMAVTPKKSKLFEFLINKNQHFTLQTDTADVTGHLKAVNSPENKVFFSYLQKSDKIYHQLLVLRKKLKQTEKKSPEYKKTAAKISALRKKNTALQNDVIRAHKGMFVSKLFEAMKEIRPPRNDSSDPETRYRYVRSHFWDHFDLSDPRLLRSPVYNEKIKTFFTRLVPMQPDSVVKAIDAVIARARPNKECVSYLIWYFTVEYQNPKYMGFDKVFVHMVDQYFAKEPVANTSPSVLKLLKERADKIRPLLLGKPAPLLILQDTSGRFVSFYDIRKKFTLLFFWDYQCHICKRQLAELVPQYPELAKKYDLALYGICINPDLKAWKAAVRNRHLPGIQVNGTRTLQGNFTRLYDIHGTPQLFLLDKNKHIIAKQFSVNQLKKILENFSDEAKKK